LFRNPHREWNPFRVRDRGCILPGLAAPAVEWQPFRLQEAADLSVKGRVRAFSKYSSAFSFFPNLR
jgi:hypothetical protein